jgi:hypothetical protein
VRYPLLSLSVRSTIGDALSPLPLPPPPPEGAPLRARSLEKTRPITQLPSPQNVTQILNLIENKKLTQSRSRNHMSLVVRSFYINIYIAISLSKTQSSSSSYFQLRRHLRGQQKFGREDGRRRGGEIRVMARYTCIGMYENKGQ